MGSGSLADALSMCQTGYDSLLKQSPPEGLVLRPNVELLDRRGNRIITKVKMRVIELIKERGFQSLENLGIKIKEHPTDGRVILNYCQINSPKEDEVVRECRALTLNKQGELVARSFPRFFNAGEALSITRVFDWNDCKAWDKLDGSLIKIFYWRNAWRIQTRNSFADSQIQEQPYTWESLVRKCLDNTYFRKFEEAFRHITFICELCSPYNQVVTYYPEPVLYLLSG